VLYMHSKPDTQPTQMTLVCNPREGMVWWVSPVTGFERDLDPAQGLRDMEAYEARLTLRAREIARLQVLEELVDKKVRRIVRAKTRGFKASGVANKHGR
jgi:hypothetical protein